MAWVAVGVSAVGAAGSFFGGKAQANAQENIARDQQAMAQQVLAQQKADRERALGLAQPTLEELNAIARQYALSDASLQAQLKSIQSDRELLDSVDPALKEAGKQALDLLQGKEAAALAPLRAERARQRQLLESSLRQQLGSGYETSSAGIEALGRFDEESAALQTNAQQQTLGAFLGLSAQVRPDVSGKIARAYGTASQIDAVGLAAQQNIAGRRVSAFNQSPVNYQPLITTAGAQYVGDLGKAQNWSNLFGGIGGLGGTLLGNQLTQNFWDKYLPRNDVSANLGGGGGGGGGAVSTSGGWNLGVNTTLPKPTF